MKLIVIPSENAPRIAFVRDMRGRPLSSLRTGSGRSAADADWLALREAICVCPVDGAGEPYQLINCSWW